MSDYYIQNRTFFLSGSKIYSSQGSGSSVNKANGEEFTTKCLEKSGVAMIPGTAFGKFATDNVRLNFATSRENISKAIEKIDKILK